MNILFRLTGLLKINNDLLFPAGIRIAQSGKCIYIKGKRPETCANCRNQGQWPIYIHGSFIRWLITIKHGKLVRIQLCKPRWQCQHCGSTCHTRSSCEIPRIQVCSLTFILILWLCIRHGREKALDLLSSVPTADEIKKCPILPDIRSIARWHQRACKVSHNTQHYIRKTVVEMSEPSPVEILFRSGLSPPETSLNRTWKQIRRVTRLYSAVEMIRRFCAKPERRNTPGISILLAKAHGRADKRQQQFLY